MGDNNTAGQYRFHEARNATRDKSYTRSLKIFCIDLPIAIICVLIKPVMGGIALFATLSIYAALRRTELSESDYYLLESSKNKNGEHRCVICGGRGIYRSTIYKTNTVRHACSKCNTLLFLK